MTKRLWIVPVIVACVAGWAASHQRGVPEAHAWSIADAFVSPQSALPRAPGTVPTRMVFTYQGRLLSGGLPVSTPVTLTFRIYDSADALLWTSHPRVLTPSRGVFSVEIGELPDPFFSPEQLPAAPASVGVAVGDAPELSPRHPLRSMLAHSATGVGVFGSSNSSIGVYGRGSVGVSGISETGTGVAATTISGTALMVQATGPGIGMYVYGDVSQAVPTNGIVKATARIGGGSPYVTRCFNSQASGPNCAIVVTRNGSGDYTLDFGFQVDDRFVSVTPEFAAGSAVIPVIDFPGTSQVRIRTYSSGSTAVDSAFHIIIY